MNDKERALANLKHLIENDKSEQDPKKVAEFDLYYTGLHNQVEFWKNLYFEEKSNRQWETDGRFGQQMGQA